MAYITFPDGSSVEVIDSWARDKIRTIDPEDYSACKWVAFGDSITAQGKYISYTQNYLGIKSENIINHGLGGGVIIDYQSAGQDAGVYIVDRNISDCIDASLVTIAYGTNDSNYLALAEEGRQLPSQSGGYISIGSLAPMRSTFDQGSFYGALQYCVEKILDANPKVRICICTPCAFTNDYQLAGETGANFSLPTCEKIVKACIDVAELYHVGLADLWHKGGRNLLNKLTCTPDGVHPNNYYAHRCAAILAPVIRELDIANDITT